MVLIIHPGKCDQAKECECPGVCPNEAWKRVNDKWIILEDKCSNCGICLKYCPAKALYLAFNDEDKIKIINKIKNDKEFQVDRLFVERYGSMPISKETFIGFGELDSKLKEGKVVLEIFEDESIECLAKSVPYFDFLPTGYKVYKLFMNDELKKKYALIKLPSLLVFENGVFLNKFEGYTNEVKRLIEFFEK